MLAATPQLALAWKVLWLSADTHPQGKDLYDAVLPAERYPVDPALLHAVVPPASLRNLFSAHKQLEWADFAADRPDLLPKADEYRSRLLAALAPAVPGA